jgi:hypothetical protein
MPDEGRRDARVGAPKSRYWFFPGSLTAGPDLLPGIPLTPLSSAPAAPDGLAAGPDLLPGTPGVPVLEVPPVPGALSWVFWPNCRELVCD